MQSIVNASLTPRLQPKVYTAEITIAIEKAMVVYKSTALTYADAIKVFKLMKQSNKCALTKRLTPEYLAADKLYSQSKIELGLATEAAFNDSTLINRQMECLERKNRLR